MLADRLVCFYREQIVWYKRTPHTHWENQRLHESLTSKSNWTQPASNQPVTKQTNRLNSYRSKEKTELPETPTPSEIFVQKKRSHPGTKSKLLDPTKSSFQQLSKTNKLTIETTLHLSLKQYRKSTHLYTSQYSIHFHLISLFPEDLQPAFHLS
jgi:hypothetical protein